MCWKDISFVFKILFQCILDDYLTPFILANSYTEIYMRIYSNNSTFNNKINISEIDHWRFHIFVRLMCLANK